METNQLTNNDRELIIALTIDYLNVYSVRPDLDKADVVKLNGYVTDGIGDQWYGLVYSKVLQTYVSNRVHPEDQERILEECSNERMLRELSHNRDMQGKYRVIDTDGSVHYYAYKYVRVSAIGEPVKVVAAFRNVDSTEAKDQQRLAELERLRHTINNANMGVWELIICEGRHPRLVVNGKMRELMGIPADMNITHEEVFDWLVSRIHPDDMPSFMQYDKRLQSGMRTECTYRWINPQSGVRYVRCGGNKVPYADGDCYCGYHYDVTDQVTKEMRSTRIIKAYASLYHFINYINFSDASFVTYTESEIVSDDLINMLLSGNMNIAIDLGLRTLVSDEHRDMMSVFCDTSTMNERLSTTNIILAQFKTSSNVWNECSFSVAERNEDGTIKSLLWAVREIDDEKQIEIRRQKQLEDNIAANRTKTKFLHNMSHEIRTPLNALFGFAQLLGLPDGTWTPEEKEEYNTYIFNSYNMLDMLIRDIMDVADSEHAGSYHVEIGDVVVNNVCRSALMSVEGRKPYNVNMYFTSDLPDDYVVKSDGRRIQQVLTNYLTNACKNTAEGEIHLHCSRTEEPGKLTFSVADTGIGVPASKADEIFKRFVKLNEYVQGAGLGLNICQMIATKLGGEVYLDKTYTNGARFVFSIEDK